jgi:hypothetical protein
MLRIVCLAVLLQLGAAAAAADEIPRVAFLGFELINSSLEPTSATEIARIAMIEDLFREKLGASRRYAFVEIPADVQQKIDSSPEIRNCNGCELDYARASGADLVAWGSVQKVSNLILNINLYMTDAKTGAPYFARSVDIRGNNDESWRHGLNYMLKNYLLKKP